MIDDEYPYGTADPKPMVCEYCKCAFAPNEGDYFNEEWICIECYEMVLDSYEG